MSAADPGAHLLQPSAWFGEAQVPSQGKGCLSHLQGCPAFSWAPGHPHTPPASPASLQTPLESTSYHAPVPALAPHPPVAATISLFSSVARLRGSCATSHPLLWDTCPRPASRASARCQSVSSPPVAQRIKYLVHPTLAQRCCTANISPLQNKGGRDGSVSLERGRVCSRAHTAGSCWGKCIRITSGAILFHWLL